jgi:L-alanine-DL-glutamate epimerase-like enolase superfamily enzyme
VTEGKKIAALAETFDRPIAPHDCTGPVQLVANLHLALSTPNTLILETVRAYTRGFYQALVTDLPEMKDGFAYPMSAPGLGTTLRPELRAREDATVRRSAI